MNIPDNFDGGKLRAKFNLGINDFYMQSGQLFIPGRPDLIEADIADCVVDLARVTRVLDRQIAAKATAKKIPNWAAWDQVTWAAWRDLNISATQISAITSLADAKLILTKMSTVIDRIVQMEIALRDQIYPDLPENGA